jgi:hypothetical protein
VTARTGTAKLLSRERAVCSSLSPLAPEGLECGRRSGRARMGSWGEKQTQPAQALRSIRGAGEPHARVTASSVCLRRSVSGPVERSTTWTTGRFWSSGTTGARRAFGRAPGPSGSSKPRMVSTLAPAVRLRPRSPAAGRHPSAKPKRSRPTRCPRASSRAGTEPPPGPGRLAHRVPDVLQALPRGLAGRMSPHVAVGEAHVRPVSLRTRPLAPRRRSVPRRLAVSESGGLRRPRP